MLYAYVIEQSNILLLDYILRKFEIIQTYHTQSKNISGTIQIDAFLIEKLFEVNETKTSL